MKKVFLLICGAMFALGANAQTYPYVVDFEGSPAPSKSYASTDPQDLSGINWTLPGVYLGSMTPDDKLNGNRAARMRRTDNQTGDPGYMQMLADLPNGIGSVTLKAANYGTEVGGNLEVFYSTNAGTSWVSAGTTGTITSTLAEYSFDVNQSGTVRLKIQKADTGIDRINIDDITMTQFGTATALTVSSKTPTGNTVPLSTNTLSLTFNENIVAGSGNISLEKVGGSTVTFAVSTATINNATATISGVALDNASTYNVSVPANAFTNTGATLANQVITWSFTTVDTSSPVEPSVITLTTLNENFDTSCDSLYTIGGWDRYSVTGDEQTWRCNATAGVDETPCVQMSGFSGGALDNEDWLITPKLDFTAMNNATLNFDVWKGDFAGDDIVVKYSTNYTGSGNPNDATWTDLSIPGIASAGETWSSVSTDISTLLAQPFFVAYKYTSNTTNASYWRIDNVKVTSNTVGIHNYNKSYMGVLVLGDAQRNNILLSIDIAKSTTAAIAVYDMQGRSVYNVDNKNLNAGTNLINLDGLNLNGGMYVIRVTNGTDFGVAKTMVK